MPTEKEWKRLFGNALPRKQQPQRSPGLPYLIGLLIVAVLSILIGVAVGLHTGEVADGMLAVVLSFLFLA